MGRTTFSLFFGFAIVCASACDSKPAEPNGTTSAERTRTVRQSLTMTNLSTADTGTGFIDYKGRRLWGTRQSLGFGSVGGPSTARPGICVVGEFQIVYAPAEGSYVVGSIEEDEGGYYAVVGASEYAETIVHLNVYCVAVDELTNLPPQNTQETTRHYSVVSNDPTGGTENATPLVGENAFSSLCVWHGLAGNLHGNTLVGSGVFASVDLLHTNQEFTAYGKDSGEAEGFETFVTCDSFPNRSWIIYDDHTFTDAQSAFWESGLYPQLRASRAMCFINGFRDKSLATTGVDVSAYIQSLVWRMDTYGTYGDTTSQMQCLLYDQAQ